MEDRRGAYRVYVVRPQRNRQLVRQDADGRILLKWIFKHWDGKTRTGSIWHRMG
jgi:hypothetical protein